MGVSGSAVLTTLVAFGVAGWLGLYLIARDRRKPALVRAGVGLIGYAGALACLPLATGGGPVVAMTSYVLAGIPAVAWTGVLVALLPDGFGLFERVWRAGCVPVGVAALVVGAVVGPVAGWPVYVGVEAVVLLPLAVTLVLAAREWRRMGNGRARALIPVATLLFFLGAAALVIPAPMLRGAAGPVVDWLPIGAWGVPLLTVSIGVDVIVLGVLVAVFDAFTEGERLPADMRRSALAAGVGAVLFGGQVGIVLAVVGDSVVLRALLFSTVGVAIAVAVFARPAQRVLDAIAFRRTPELTAARSELRDAADALGRHDDRHPLADATDAEFARLVRQALRNYGDLGKLVASPLTELPAISSALVDRGGTDQPLERAAELKRLLLAGIEHLRPEPTVEFGNTDEWRHFNALYFVYVVGVRPYRRQADRGALDPVARQAFDWFRRSVPERTLYNWQDAATRAVATHLRSVNWPNRQHQRT